MADDLRSRVARACRVLGTLDLTKAATGHISARIPGTDRVLIRARGPGELGVRYTGADQVIEVDFDGNIVAGEAGLDVPLEVFIHTGVYKARPDVNAVVHVHPPTVVLFTICGLPLLPIYGAYDPASLQLALDGIPTFDRSVLINTPQLGDDLARAIGHKSVCLMRGHGITTAGPSIEEAALYSIQLNELATMNYHAHLLGHPRPIAHEDQEAFRHLERGPKSSDGTLVPGRAAALWRYYVELTGVDR